MINLQSLPKRRRELRFPFSVPVILNEMANGKKIHYGKAENISRRGTLVSLNDSIPHSSQISISFHVQYQKPAITNSGHVRWTLSQNGENKCGIEMLETNPVRLPLEKVSEYIENAWQTSESQEDLFDPNLNRKEVNDFSFEIYWGMLLWTFQAPLQKQLSKLAHDLSLGNFYLEKLRADILDSKKDEKARLASCQKILDKGGLAISNLNSLSTLLKLMQEEHVKLQQKQLPEFFSLDTFLSDRIHNLKNKLSCLNISNSEMIRYRCLCSPELVGHYPSLSKGFDYLLLFTYQTIAFQNTKNIQIRLTNDKKEIIVDFICDGSQTLQEKYLEISTDKNASSLCSNPKDIKQVSLLCFALKFFSQLKARLLVWSEAGNNLISLRIPRSFRS